MRTGLSRMTDASGAAFLAALREALVPGGLNLIGATPVAAYDETVPRPYALGILAPGAVSAVVIGNGGGAFWAAFRAFCLRHPGYEATPHPLDAFTLHMVDTTTRPLVSDTARVLYPFRFPDQPVSFMHLAACAGLGRRSLTGVLIHPVYGPWIALRAAILVPFAVHAPRPAALFDPCPSCTERACVAACPAGAVTPAGWDVPRCAAHRLRDDDPCAARCQARFDCVIGREHRYPPDALTYHQARARPALAPFAERSR